MHELSDLVAPDRTALVTVEMQEGVVGEHSLVPLRNLGITTIVATGVSVNVAILGFGFEAVNLGYQFVLPRDAVAGVDETYVDAGFARTLSLLATVTTTSDVCRAW